MHDDDDEDDRRREMALPAKQIRKKREKKSRRSTCKKMNHRRGQETHVPHLPNSGKTRLAEKPKGAKKVETSRDTVCV